MTKIRRRRARSMARLHTEAAAAVAIGGVALGLGHAVVNEQEPANRPPTVAVAAHPARPAFTVRAPTASEIQAADMARFVLRPAEPWHSPVDVEPEREVKHTEPREYRYIELSARTVFTTTSGFDGVATGYATPVVPLRWFPGL